MSDADVERILRNDDDELPTNDLNDDEFAELLGFVRFLVVAGVVGLEADEQRLRRRCDGLFVCGPVLRGERLRADDGSVYEPRDLNDDNDAGPVLVLLFVNDDLDDDDPEPVFVKLRV